MSREVADWVSIEGAYRAGRGSLREIAGEHGITEGAIRKRAKREGWLRDPEGAKRERVRAALSGGTRQGTQYAQETIETETEHDVCDMRSGLEVARGCIARLKDVIGMTDDPKDIKVIAEANRIAVETIRRIRGLDDQQSAQSIVIERSYG